jgi:hypothetical protein
VWAVAQQEREPLSECWALLLKISKMGASFRGFGKALGITEKQPQFETLVYRGSDLASLGAPEIFFNEFVLQRVVGLKGCFSENPRAFPNPQKLGSHERIVSLS